MESRPNWFYNQPPGFRMTIMAYSEYDFLQGGLQECTRVVMKDQGGSLGDGLGQPLAL